MDYKVKFRKGTWEQYASITPNEYTFYFITDLDKIYLGTVELSNVQVWQQINLINDKLENKAGIEVKTKEEWAQNPQLVSEKNTFYVYSNRSYKEDPETGQILYYIPGVKIGDGTSYLIDLPFMDEDIYDHINNSTIHITQQEREKWNNKNRGYVLDGSENLILTIN